MLTNRLGLPEAIVRAVQNDPYTRGESRISVTSLITPPYQRKLKEEHEAVEDVSDRMWALVGQIGHGIVERAYPDAYNDEIVLWPRIKKFFEKLHIWTPFLALCKMFGINPELKLTPAQIHERYGFVAEQRLYMDVEGWTISGQFDVIEADHLMDYKFTSTWSVKGETKIEWEQQLNLLRLLSIRAGITINRLRIIAVLRDWSKGQSKRGGDYPPQGVVPVDIPVWTVEQTEAYLRERVLAHQNPNPPPCTDEERWAKPAVWAVMKDGRKSAVKLHPTASSANQHAAELGKGHSVDHRPGVYTRCQDYCSVSHVCPQFKSEVLF